MNRHTAFVMAVQTAVITSKGEYGRHERSKSFIAVRAVARAAGLPEEALGTVDVGVAALEFVDWVVLGDVYKPEWIAAWEQARGDRVLVSIKEDANSTVWWEAVGVAFEATLTGNGHVLPKSCYGLLVGEARQVTISKADATLFEAWSKQVTPYAEPPFAYSTPED